MQPRNSQRSRSEKAMWPRVQDTLDGGTQSTPRHLVKLRAKSQGEGETASQDTWKHSSVDWVTALSYAGEEGPGDLGTHTG